MFMRCVAPSFHQRNQFDMLQLFHYHPLSLYYSSLSKELNTIQVKTWHNAMTSDGTSRVNCERLGCFDVRMKCKAAWKQKCLLRQDEVAMCLCVCVYTLMCMYTVYVCVFACMIVWMPFVCVPFVGARACVCALVCVCVWNKFDPALHDFCSFLK